MVCDVVVNYNGLPDHLRDAMQKYIESGVQPGHFLTAVICNDLVESFSRADMMSKMALEYIAAFMYNEAPSDCWGDGDKMTAWMKEKGLKGREAST